VNSRLTDDYGIISFYLPAVTINRKNQRTVNRIPGPLKSVALTQNERRATQIPFSTGYPALKAEHASLPW
jgi:hypothetical protein